MRHQPAQRAGGWGGRIGRFHATPNRPLALPAQRAYEKLNGAKPKDPPRGQPKLCLVEYLFTDANRFEKGNRMRMYPDPKLPLKPKGAFERYLLYTFESRERWLVMQGILVAVALAMWALTHILLFGVLAAFSLVHLYLGFEARAICRMIRRASNCEDERVG
jgi:hypothetical protein